MPDTPVTLEPDEKQVPSPTPSVSGPADQPGVKEGVEDTRSPSEKAAWARVTEEANKRRAVEEKLQKIEDENKKVRDEELKAQGDYKTLLDEQTKQLDALKAVNEEFEKQQKARREMIYESLSEEQRKIADTIGSLEGLELYAKSVASGAGLPTDTGVPGRPGGEYGGYSSRAEWAAKDSEAYSKWKAERRPTGVSGSVTLPDGTVRLIK